MLCRDGDWLTMNTLVAVVKTQQKPSDKEIDVAVRHAVRLIGGMSRVVKTGDRVVIKPNLVIARAPDTGATTDPRVCRAIADMVMEHGGKPTIAESSFVGLDTEEAIEVAGYNRLREQGYEVIDLKARGTERVTIPVPQGTALKEVSLPKIIVDADVIVSVPKMKTHDQSGATLSIKNMKGVLPDAWKRSFHHRFGVFHSTAELLTVLKPSLSVVDGITAMSGVGPAYGDPVEMDLIIAGKDPVAVDTVTGAIMGFALHELGCVREAARLGVGTGDLKSIEVVGESISRVCRKFKHAEEAIAELLQLPEGFDLVVNEKACSGCRNQILSSLLDMREAGLLESAAGWTVVAGKADELPVVTTERLLLVGACLANFKRQARFVQGCPPNSRDVIRGFGVNEAVGMVNIDAIEAEET